MDKNDVSFIWIIKAIRNYSLAQSEINKTMKDSGLLIREVQTWFFLSFSFYGPLSTTVVKAITVDFRSILGEWQR